MDNTDDTKKTAEVAGSFPVIQLSRSGSSGGRNKVSPTPPIDAYEITTTGKFAFTAEERIAKAIEIYEKERNYEPGYAENLAQLAFIQKKTESNKTEYKIELKEVYTKDQGKMPSPEVYQSLSIRHTNREYIKEIHNCLIDIDPNSTSYSHPLNENGLATVTMNITKLAEKEKPSLLWKQIKEYAPSIPETIWSKLKSQTGCEVSSSPSQRPR